MKRILFLMCVVILFSSSYANAANDWRGGTGENTILGTENVSDIDTKSFQDVVDPLDRLLSNFREGAKVTYNSASSIDVESGEVVCSSSDGSARRFRSTTSTTTLTWSDIDTGAEGSSTTYYVYANCDADATTFTGTISANSTTPNGLTYWKKLGSFYNDSSSNILNDETVTNDHNYYALTLGDWVSKSFAVAYQATTDGMLVGYLSCADPSNGDILAYSDVNSSPTTLRSANSCTRSESVGHSVRYAGASIPVKRGDYYKATKSTSGSVSSGLFFIPNQ